MGAAATVIGPTFELMSPRLWADPQVRRLWQSCEEKLGVITTKEREFLLSQKGCMFRKHDEIIRVLTCKTKKQLKRLVNGKVPGSCITVDEVESLGGGPYANFLGTICRPEIDCRFKELDLSIGGVGCNEDGVVIALSACTTAELNAVKTYRGKPLVDLIRGKSKPGSQLQKFLLAILQEDRNGENQPIDADSAAAQAQEIHMNGASREFGVVEDPIFSILTKASRAQCQAIDAAYLKLHNMTLVAALSSKFSGAVRLGLCMWVQSKPAAAAFLFNYLVASSSCDSNLVARTLGRYEKPMIKDIDAECKAQYNKSLYELLGNAMNGNFAKAVLRWINSPTADNGSEYGVTAFIEEQMVWQGGKDLQTFLFEMAGTQLVCDNLKNLLSSQEKGLLTYLDQYLHEDYVIMQSLSVSSDPKNARASFKSAKNQSVGLAPPSTKRGQIVASGKSRRQGVPVTPSVTSSDVLAAAGAIGEREHESHETSLNLVSSYLVGKFHEFDPQGYGAVPTDVFWQYFDSLGLVELGFTHDEAEGMKTWVDWEHDGQINIEEVKEELADSIVDSIGGVGKNVEQTMKEMMKTLPEERRIGGKLPPDLLDYLRATFEAYDMDRNGVLNYEEFWQLINAMSLGIASADYEQIHSKWDGNKDGMISWSEAIEQFTRLLSGMIEDGQDHWIGLADRETGALYWFNLADSSSEWMNEEDQANFQAHAVAAAEQPQISAPSPMNPMAIKRRSTGKNPKLCG